MIEFILLYIGGCSFLIQKKKEERTPKELMRQTGTSNLKQTNKSRKGKGNTLTYSQGEPPAAKNPVLIHVDNTRIHRNIHWCTLGFFF